MSNVLDRLKQYGNRQPGVLHILVALTYLLFIFYYMTPQVTHCNTTVYGFGDNTAGPIWRHSVSPNGPLWGYEKVTNYPYGDNLYSPVSYSAAGQYTAYWLLAKVAGPICGYNVFNFIGFFTAALVMYGFIYALTRRRWIAWLAGYAVAFSPYFQMKVGGHPGYGYEALLVGLVWLFYNSLKYRKLKFAIGLGTLYAFCFYFDPYFSLLASIVLFSMGAAWLLSSAVSRRRISKNLFMRQLKLAAAVAITAGLLLSPLIYIKIADSAAISSSVVAARGNVLAEARACSILPYQYNVPFVLNPVFTKLLGGNYYKMTVDSLMGHFKCGIAEDSVTVSLAVTTVATTGLIVLAWERLNKRRSGLARIITYEPHVFIGGIILMALVAIAIGFPPAKIAHIPTPSKLMLDLTTTWRTLARVYVVVNIAAVTLFAVILSYYAQHFKNHKRYLGILFAVLFLIIFVEYQAFRPFAGNKLSNYNYTSSPPVAYKWLSKQKEVKTIAEYPLEREGGESNAGAYYLSMQSTHHKNLFNSALSNSPQEYIRSSLKNLADPQTVKVLSSLGVDTVIVHGVPKEDVQRIPYLQVVYTASQADFNLLAYTPLVTKDNVVIAKIVNAPKVTTMLDLREGEFPRNTTIIHSSVDWSYEALQNSHIDIVSLAKSPDTSTPVCFNVRMSVPTESDELTLRVDGQSQQPVLINGNFQQVRTSAKHIVELHNKHGHNMQVGKLGC